MDRLTVYDFYGRNLGSVETQSNGDRIARDFYGAVLGRYIRSENVTKDFYGKTLARCDITTGMVYYNSNR